MSKSRLVLVCALAIFLAIVGITATLRSFGERASNQTLGQENRKTSFASIDWKVFSDDGSNACYRTKVPGGWLILIRCVNGPNHRGEGVGTTFLPDPEHKWDGASVK
jgi:hypothetical protein